MKKVCHNWEGFIDQQFITGKYWPEFESNASAVTAEIEVVKSYDEALEVIKKTAKEAGFKNVAVIGGEDNSELKEIYEKLADDFTIFEDKMDIAKNANNLDLGITIGEFGVGETGSVCVDNYAYEARIASMLPTMNIVFLKKNLIVKDMQDAFNILDKVFDKGYAGFVTGPSRTSDIERVLTLGVHGPKRFMIIAMDN